jgi:hypothetical protein
MSIFIFHTCASLLRRYFIATYHALTVTSMASALQANGGVFTLTHFVVVIATLFVDIAMIFTSKKLVSLFKMVPRGSLISLFFP